MVIDYFDIYNKLTQQPTTAKTVKRKILLSHWLMEENRRKAAYNVEDITLLNY